MPMGPPIQKGRFQSIVPLNLRHRSCHDVITTPAAKWLTLLSLCVVDAFSAKTATTNIVIIITHTLLDCARSHSAHNIYK